MKTNGTTFAVSAGDKGAVAGDALLVPLLAKPQPPLELVARVDKLCDGAVTELLAVQPLDERVGRVLHTTRSGACRRVLLIGLGEAEKLDEQNVRRAAATAARWLINERIRSATLWIDGLATSRVENATAEWVLGFALAGFRFEEFRKPDEKAPTKIDVQIRASESGHVQRVMPAVRDALTLADAVNYARQLAHQPANVINPTTLAAEARRLARDGKLRCTVFPAAQLKQMGAAGLLAVGQGAALPPCLIQLTYRGAPRSRTTTVLVGKAITFDTGGYCIKPSANLDELKFDKCGGAAVLAVLRAARDLKLKCNLVGLVPAAENAISENAYRPGDILKMMNGKTVEVINTDAEGRLILADALCYAQQKLKPTALIDIATLTGGVRVALGTAAAGLLSNDDTLAADLGEAGRRTHERLWRLPLWDDYRELIKGQEADVKNAAGKRDAHPIVGAMFLKEFVADDVPWAHLDIAAVATNDNGNDMAPKGATGFGVRLLIEFLRQRGA
jgi:leucyl aminopeptidase